VRDVAPGEAVYITFAGELHSRQCAEQSKLAPCLFEYVYFARPDSIIDGASVHAARLNMGEKLAEKIRAQGIELDVVIPIPDTSLPSALELAKCLNLPFRMGFIKNRYVGRTFIMPGKDQKIIAAFYGIGTPELTLEEIGTKYHLTRERVRQIKEKTIRRLRNKTTDKLLKSYLG
jgi:glutamine phosphoribosylpyrophosphate amidotransferase